MLHCLFSNNSPSPLQSNPSALLDSDMGKVENDCVLPLDPIRIFRTYDVVFAFSPSYAGAFYATCNFPIDSIVDGGVSRGEPVNRKDTLKGGRGAVGIPVGFASL